ncbi:MAG: hypothetical protein KAI29_18700 [Cyclobacteriaceae bacterium]|nr:hypothetical protein [Cyclobacteriaceae bacterium]
MNKFFKGFLVLFAGLLLILLTYFYFNVRDRHPGYNVDLSIKNEKPVVLKVGFSAVSITPEVMDHWTDINGDAKYIPGDGDTFEDRNGNGKFDPIWIAGFSNKRAANGVHDKLWARTMVVDDGQSRIAITSIDAIGFMNDDILDVKELISKEAEITYSVISSTHTHEAPDLIGIWGESLFKSGVNPDYLADLKKKTAQSIDEAAKNLKPAKLKLAINPKDAIVVVKDTRKPIVFDEGLRMIQAISTETNETFGTLVAWADHPETLWSDNLLISSDFPHYVREGVENGVYSKDSLIHEGLGGVAVYFNGAIGGLMTTHPSLEVKDIFTGEVYNEPTYEKTKAQGDYLAYLGLKALDSSDYFIEKAGISIRAKSIDLKFKNPIFRLGALLGLMNRGMNGWMQVRSELAVFSIGPAHFVTVPGEIYPEIINGGVEAPEGQDFDIDPVEVPYIRSQMKGDFNFVFGLANDMVGYIIPKSQWDEDEPFTYGEDSAPYGEVNSLGPETGPTIHRELGQLLDEFYRK